MVYRDRVQGLQSAVRAPHTDNSESLETTLQTTLYIGYRRSDMVYRDRFQGLQSAVHAAPTDGAVVGARSTRPLWASPKCFQNPAGVEGAGFGRSQNQTTGPIGFGVPGMMLWHRRACYKARRWRQMLAIHQPNACPMVALEQ